MLSFFFFWCPPVILVCPDYVLSSGHTNTHAHTPTFGPLPFIKPGKLDNDLKIYPASTSLLCFCSFIENSSLFRCQGYQFSPKLTESLFPHSWQADLRLRHPRSAYRAASGSALSRSTTVAQGLFRAHFQGLGHSYPSNQPGFPLPTCRPAGL